MQLLNFVWLELTGKCQLACEHCYAESSPRGTHGLMTFNDWSRVIDEAASAGATDVQFIDGEPTLHPHLLDLVNRALARRLNVEVFTNLVRVTAQMWETFAQVGVRLATSYYSDRSVEHDAITARRGAHTRTRANIAEAVRRGIPLRTGVIEVRDGQRVSDALSQLERLGVTDVGTDRLRQVGRGQRGQRASMDELCGNCASGVLAVAPDGTVWPCVFARWLPVGNVRVDSLATILSGTALTQVRSMLTDQFALRGDISACRPDDCKPRCDPTCQPFCNPYCQPTCQPQCGPACTPKRDCSPSRCEPEGNCWPKYGDCKPNKGR